MLLKLDFKPSAIKCMDEAMLAKKSGDLEKGIMRLKTATTFEEVPRLAWLGLASAYTDSGSYYESNRIYIRLLDEKCTTTAVIFGIITNLVKSGLGPIARLIVANTISGIGKISKSDGEILDEEVSRALDTEFHGTEQYKYVEGMRIYDVLNTKAEQKLGEARECCLFFDDYDGGICRAMQVPKEAENYKEAVAFIAKYAALNGDFELAAAKLREALELAPTEIKLDSAYILEQNGLLTPEEVERVQKSLLEYILKNSFIGDINDMACIAIRFGHMDYATELIDGALAKFPLSCRFLQLKVALLYHYGDENAQALYKKYTLMYGGMSPCFDFIMNYSLKNHGVSKDVLTNIFDRNELSDAEIDCALDILQGLADGVGEPRMLTKEEKQAFEVAVRTVDHIETEDFLWAYFKKIVTNHYDELLPIIKLMLMEDPYYVSNDCKQMVIRLCLEVPVFKSGITLRHQIGILQSELKYLPDDGFCRDPWIVDALNDAVSRILTDMMVPVNYKSVAEVAKQLVLKKSEEYSLKPYLTAVICKGYSQYRRMGKIAFTKLILMDLDKKLFDDYLSHFGFKND